MSDIIKIAPTATLNGDDVCRIAFGTMRLDRLDDNEFDAALLAALEAGFDVLDTAPIYGFGLAGLGMVERRIGDSFRRHAEMRKHFHIVTKAGIEPPTPYDSRAENLIASCEASLENMGVEVIDLFLIHRPDLLVAWDEVAKALDNLKTRGLIQSAGVSNFSPAQVDALQSKLGFNLVATQPEISLSHIEPLFDGTLDHAQAHNLLPMAWSPLGGLAGDKNSTLGTSVDEVARKHDVERASILLAWLLAHPARIMPVIGSTNPERIRAAMRAMTCQLTRRDWYLLTEASRGAPMP